MASLYSGLSRSKPSLIITVIVTSSRVAFSSRGSRYSTDLNVNVVETMIPLGGTTLKIVMLMREAPEVVFARTHS